MESQFALILPFFPAAIQELIVDRATTEIMINGGGKTVAVERNGELMVLSGVQMNPEQLQAGIENIARLCWNDLTPEYPLLDSRLPDGSRVAAIGPPNSPTGVTLTIRKFNRWFSTGDLMHLGTLPRQVFPHLAAAVGERKNILISGNTGSGKTALLKAFADHIPEQDRLLVIERPMELRLEQPNVVRLEATNGLPGRPDISVGQLVAAALRHRPDRILLGEIRPNDQSAWHLIEAIHTGHGGTLATLHAANAHGALMRLAMMAMAGKNLPVEFVMGEVAEAIQYVVHIERMPDRSRKITELVAVRGFDARTRKFQCEVLYDRREAKAFSAAAGISPSLPESSFPSNERSLCQHH
ncbi:MAG TPA: ATPase, T2SS/T4P/T4SS family [Bryobacteraceae bacterium]